MARRLGRIALVVILCGLAASAVVVLRPVQAASIKARAASVKYNCAIKGGSCVSATNSKDGEAITAVSVGNAALNATSQEAYGIVAYTTTGRSGYAGVLGIDQSKSGSTANAGVLGTSSKGYGIFGNSDVGVGVGGISEGFYGVEGTTQTSPPYAGVYGIDDGNMGAYGVAGQTTSGTGVAAFALTGIALYGSSQGSGLLTFSSGYSGTAATTVAEGASGIGFRTVAPTGATVMLGTNSTSQQDVLSVDSSGNEILAGTLTENGQPTIRTATSIGKTVATYGARTSSPTVEDFGEGQLSGGEAYVALEPTFAATIDARSKYMVFLTPEGDNRGLYVTAKSGRGFTVRESNDGHSTIGFDYRIVAKPFDTNAARLASTTTFAGLQHGRPIPNREPRPAMPAKGGVAKHLKALRSVRQ